MLFNHITVYVDFGYRLELKKNIFKDETDQRLPCIYYCLDVNKLLTKIQA